MGKRCDILYLIKILQNTTERQGTVLCLTVRTFDVELLIRNASDGNKYLYDIVEIKENTTTEIGLLERVTRLSDKSQTTRDSVSNERVSQKSKSVSCLTCLK